VFLLAGLLTVIVVFAFFVWTVALFTIRPKYFFGLWIGVPALCLGILIFFFWAISFYHSRPTVVFRESLGFVPPPDVTIINSLRHEPIDWNDTYLEFYADDSTINRILQDGFVAIHASDIIDDTYYPPHWWTPPTGPSIRIYATNTYDPHFRDKTWRWSVRHKLLIYDRDSGDTEKRKVYIRYRRS
jgi:hypothetical protein